MKKKITAKYVIGFDGEDHVIIRDGEVVYENDTILFVGHDYAGEVDEVIDAGNAVVSPGFIDLNALGDIDHDVVHLEASVGRNKNLLWSEDYYRKGYHEVMTPEEEAFKSLFAYSQLILNGVTTAMPITSVFYKRWAETYEELAAAADHAGKLGLRMYMGPSYQSGMRVVKANGEIEVLWNEAEGQAGLERAVQFVKDFDGAHNGLIRGMLAPERIETQTPENLVNTKRYSDELGCPIRLHAAQGAYEYNEMYRRHNKSPVQFLHSIGFLGQKTAIPHAHFIPGYSEATIGEGDDLALLQETGTTVIHCPLVIGRHGSALESFARYKRHGINIAIGTDTFPPDFIQNIRTASMFSRLQEGDVADSSYADIYRAATLGGARFLGRDDLGRLAPGAKADIIAIDLDGFHLGTIDDPIRSLIMSGSGRDVKLSIIAGRIVMKDRELPGVDLEEVKAKGQRYFDKMRLGYVERDYQQLGAEELFTPSFRVVKKG
ncbi:ethylammeline chlorohydrolase [Brevibacillus reuszeri]|uniref:Ethylammeline chlorohydrolase n=1 Tax=Brevibacillus reuszeri TaxID=54915 RepID=A0A0K9YY96_9BACL|nr:amidohydrolase family protein [Brevibacillus reuszeri]KNB73622.1 ethylammeline chlorohydrolase [Brevibacillus reuszeri]MED1858573.1 amidohydrolase family protein [Brevibacillus reuszeri]GED69548.1 ethylammeline chlorohydrolase [Brevibacillus reuszeri]